MQTQKQVIYADLIMDDAAPGTIAWLCFGRKNRLDFSMGADKPFLRAEIRCSVVRSGDQLMRAYIDALPKEKDNTIESITLKMIKDIDGRWHTIQATTEYREP